MTNASAMTALKTLQMTNKSLDQTENRISTGYKVATASDNAAYWSIATTMRSDNKALSTVQDALGLGSATIDVAYTAMDSVKDVLDQIKTKLVSASQPGVDKSKIQSDISELQKQLQTYASSASFSGNNWLSVDSSSSSYSAIQSVVSSFNRSSDNQVSISTIDIDIGDISLFDASSASKGLLEDSGTSAVGTSTGTYALTAGDLDNGGTLTVKVKVDGKEQSIDMTVADTTNFTIDDLVAGLNAGLKGATASKDGSGNLVLTSASIGTSASVELGAVSGTKVDGTATTGTGIAITMGEAKGADTGGIGITDIDITSASASQLATYTAVVEGMSQKVTTAAANLGSVKSRIDMQQDFVKNLMDAVDRGVGALVDADMSQESTRLQALQTQQQLGIQALSIANSNSQSILSLFR
jgi:flagellin